MAAPPKREIELLPQEDWEKTSFGRLLKWSLGAGRYIVIVTELIVIFAFLSRFKLDRDLTNLYDEIKQKQAIIEANREFEKEFRFLQNRLTEAENLQSQQAQTAGVIEALASLIPIDVSLEGLRVKDQEVSLTAIAFSEEGLGSFLNNLKKSPQFEKLSLSSVSSGAKQGIGIQFQLKSQYQAKK